MTVHRTISAQLLATIALAIFFILGMVTTKAYSIATALLLLVSLYTVIRYRHQIDWPAEKGLVGIFLLYALIGIITSVIDGHTSRDYESPVRFLLAIPILYAMAYLGINQVWLMLSIALGGIAMMLYGMYDAFALGIDRVGESPIRFGNIGMLTAFFAFISLFFIPAKVQHRHLLQALLLVGGIGGLIASLLSGTRGGWLLPIAAIPILAICIACQSQKARKAAIAFIIFCCSGIAVLYLIPNTGIASRVQLAVTELKNYQPNSDSANTSVGARLEMWRLAIKAIEEKPWTGWGIKGYRYRIDKFHYDGEGAAVVLYHRHPHNDVLNEAAKRGIFSSIVMIFGLYLFPFWQFAKRIRHPNAQVRYFALLGIVFITAWVMFGLVDSFLEWNQVILYYLIYMSVFWGGMRYEEKRT